MTIVVFVIDMEVIGLWSTLLRAYLLTLKALMSYVEVGLCSIAGLGIQAIYIHSRATGSVLHFAFVFCRTARSRALPRGQTSDVDAIATWEMFSEPPVFESVHIDLLIILP